MVTELLEITIYNNKRDISQEMHYQVLLVVQLCGADHTMLVWYLRQLLSGLIQYRTCTRLYNVVQFDYE